MEMKSIFIVKILPETRVQTNKVGLVYQNSLSINIVILHRHFLKFKIPRKILGIGLMFSD